MRHAKVLLATPRTREDVTDRWVSCRDCAHRTYVREARRNLNVCGQCGHHGRLAAHDRIAQLADAGSFDERDADLVSADPLDFVAAGHAYLDKLRETKHRTGLADAAVSGRARIGDLPVELVVLDFSFIGASMGSVVGEKIARAVDRASRRAVALITVSASGGARMHEGVFSLMQMGKTVTALEQLGAARVPHIAVLTDPTLGGVSASYVGIADVIVAEQGALIGFAGPRVIESITKQRLPPSAQRAESLLQHGLVDMVVHRRELRPTIARLVRLYANAG